MPTEKIILGNEEFEIEVRPITLITKAANVVHDIQTPERIMIDCQMTISHTDSVVTLHPLTPRLFKMVFTDWRGDVTPESVRREGTGAKHVLGLIDLSLVYFDQRIQFGWRYPESYLHPALQCQLADVLIFLMNLAERGIDVTL